MRVRGLKQTTFDVLQLRKAVAPRAGAWIETKKTLSRLQSYCVAPRAGAWIETPLQVLTIDISKSHPVRVRGLKLCTAMFEIEVSIVAPRAGAWIETKISTPSNDLDVCRTPCGCVD